MAAIDITQLNKIYPDGTRALKDVNFTVAPGDFFGLIGANGAGKTTMIGIMTGLVNKTGGSVRIFGNAIDTHFAAAKRFIGVVPQEFNFNIFERVEDILVNQAGYFGLSAREAVQRAAELLNRLGLWGKRHTVSRSLSGGMKRRLMIARALIHQPQLLILDEPTAGVDVELRYGMWDYLRELNRQGMTILLTTHYLEEIEQMCRHAAIIKEGVIIRSDEVSRLVQVMDRDTFVFTVKEFNEDGRLAEFRPRVIDKNMFEVDLDRHNGLHLFLQRLQDAGLVVTDIRPRGQRLERLFLDIMKQPGPGEAKGTA